MDWEFTQRAMKVVISWPTFNAICRSWNDSFFSSCLPFQCTPLAMRKKQGAGGKILKKWAAVLNMPFAAETPRSARWHRTTPPLIRSRRGPLPCLSSEFWMCHIRLPLLLRHRGLTGNTPRYLSPPIPEFPFEFYECSCLSLAPDRCTAANGICFCGRQVVKRDSQ